MKKLLAVLCTMAMLISMFSMTAAAEEVTYTQVTDIETVKAGGEFVVVAKYVTGGTTIYLTVDLVTEITTKIESLVVNVADGVVTYDGEMPLVQIAACEDGVSLLDNVGDSTGYIGWDSTKPNKFNTTCQETPYKWDLVANADGTFSFTTNSGDRWLAFRDNSSSDKGVVHRWCVATTATLDERHVVELMLFKATVNSGSTPAPTPTPNPGPSIDDTADINTMPLYAVLAMGVAVVTFASKKRFAK